MPRTTPDEVLSRAADLRAGGTSWEATADCLGFDADELQQLSDRRRHERARCHSVLDQA